MGASLSIRWAMRFATSTNNRSKSPAWLDPTLPSVEAITSSATRPCLASHLATSIRSGCRPLRLPSFIESFPFSMVPKVGNKEP
jgi:hypothetical protein